MNVLYRKYKPSDKEQIIQLLSLNRQNKEAYVEFMKETWEWFYFENPYAQQYGGDIIVCESFGKVIGATGLLNETLLIHNKEKIACWATNLIVDPEMRGKGIGKELIRRRTEVQNISLAKGVSDSAYYIQRKTGFTSIKDVKILCFDFRPYTLSIKDIIKSIYCRALLKVVPKLPNEYRIEFSNKLSNVRKLEEYLSHLMDSISKEYLVIKKNAAYIQWKYLGTPLLSNTMALLKRNEKILAVIIYIQKPTDPEHIVIQEILCSNENAVLIKSMIKQLITQFVKTYNVKRVTTAHSCGYIKNELTFLGFRILKNFSRFSFFSQDKNTQFKILNSIPWYLSYGDSDGSYLKPE